MTVLGEAQPTIKFSIVTPTFNAEKYLAQTIASVIGQQGDFDIEYIIVDNESTDRTLGIVEEYLARMGRINSDRQAGHVSLSLVCKKDRGMYEGINRGFSIADGDLFAWINADDLYLPGAFEKVAQVFAAMPQVKWLKGITSYIDEQGRSLSAGKCYLYAQELIRRGLYGREAYFIQQDSVFWRAALWRNAGGLNETFRLAGDYELWMRFAEREALYTLNSPVSCFRKASGQLSENMANYREEQQRIERPCSLHDMCLRGFFKLVEPRLPDWLDSLVFRVFCPFTSLHLVDGNSGHVHVRKSFKYKV